MQKITVSVPGREYPILIGEHLLDTLGEQVREVGIRGAVALVQDAGVAAICGERARRSLEAAGCRVASITVPSGESSKSLQQLGRLYDALTAASLDRGSALIALGGGVVGDLAGFAAATYLRGIALVQVPTTLLAQVDASIGGKTAIDLPAGKNLVGAFHQPCLVLIDPDTLATLPAADYRAGLAEVLKYGIIADAGFFRYLEMNREAILAHYPDRVEHVVARSCEIKAEVVSRDERESGLRAILNYGHTIAHAVEAAAGYGEYLHGEAVAIGMVAAGRLSRRLGGLPREQEKRIERLISLYGLPSCLRAALSPEALVHAMRLDKKFRNGEFRFILAREIGRVEIAAVPEPLVREALEDIQPE